MGLTKAAIQAQIAAGGGGAFWNAPSGKTVINLNWNNNGQYKTQNTGIILTPTPGVWSLYQWQFDSIRVQQNSRLAASLATGFIVFSNIAGAPNVRFGTGLGNPGFGAFGNLAESFSQPYNDPLNSSPGVPGFGVSTDQPNLPIGILASGEVVFSMTDDNGPDLKAVRGVLTISPELPALGFPLVIED